MKKATSLLLTLILIVSVFAVIPTNAAAESFQAGDELYLKIENPSNWATLEGTQLYVNFTDATRAENNNSSIVIANANKSRYNPAGGVQSAGANLYKYTFTEATAGATVMRFWRGNGEKLWNESVAITPADLAAGRNTAVVTDWTNTGYLTSTYDYEITAVLTLSAREGSASDSYDITLTHNELQNALYTYEIAINDEKVSDQASYTFIPGEDGLYTVKATVTAKDQSGHVLAKDSKSDTITVGTAPVRTLSKDSLYAHAAKGSKEREAWVRWYNVNGTYYFFLPSSCKAYDGVELYSTLYAKARLDNTDIPYMGVAIFKPEAGKTYRLTIGNEDTYRNVVFLYSSAEAALWVNNTDTFDYYGDFFSYLKADKSNFVAASGAIATPNGTVSDTDIKKMKGRGNTSWYADKKGFNVTFKDAISIAGMPKGKKFSLVSNFQDAAMGRNRILFDLAAEVGVPYSSDSRFIDLYTNGVYQGTYQIFQKIDVGKNTLVSDFAEDDYLDTETNGVKRDFCFLTEIDSSPAADDFHFTVANGNNLTMKAPELATDNPNYNAVRSYITDKYNTMYSHLTKADANDYIDLDSLAKVYLINELGKNWDSGASSFYLTYKPDENGVYKFFASPVWDYDNSLGNARGVDSDLRRLGITDYTLPTGWFSSKKNGYNGPNFLAEAVKSPSLMSLVRQVWFEDFLPAINKLNESGIDSGRLYSLDVYADILRDTAAMNYKIWDMVTNSGWIADHGSLTRFGATYTYNDFGQVTGVTLTRCNTVKEYNRYTFDGQFEYMTDWLNSRAAWISTQYIDDYQPREPELLRGDVDFDGEVDIPDVTLILRFGAQIITPTDLQKRAGDVNGDGECDTVDATLIQRYLAHIIDHI